MFIVYVVDQILRYIYVIFSSVVQKYKINIYVQICVMMQLNHNQFCLSQRLS